MVANQPDTVSHSIDEFMEALWEAIAIVLGVSMVSLGLRAGSVVIVSIPLVLAIVFAAMEGLGIDLQRISLGALIIALGLLVDDAMITIESMVSRLERGDTKEQAAVFAYESTAFPRLTGTLVTIAGFLPSASLAATPANIPSPCSPSWPWRCWPPGWSPACLHRSSAWCCSALRRTRMARPWVRRCACSGAAWWRRCGPSGSPSRSRCALFAASLAGTRLVPEQFFPASDRPELLVDLKLQDNASILATRDAAEAFDKVLAADPDVDVSPPMSARVPSASTCRSTSPCRTTSSPSRSW